MSIMIVSNSTFQKVAQTLFTLKPQCWMVRNFLDSAQERFQWKNKFDGITGELEKLRSAMYESYQVLYKEEKRDPAPISYSGLQDQYENLSALLKALECIHYQIELKGFDDRFILQLMSRVKDAIINDLPDYQNAQWG